MPMIVAAAVWAAGDVIGLFLPTGVANLAHLIGLGFGIGAGLYLRKGFAERRGVPLDPESERLIDDWERKWVK